VLSQIKTNSVVQMDIGVSAYWLGYAEMNNALRVATGAAPVLVTGVPRVFDLNNIAAAGNPPSFADGYGNNLVGPFKTAWGLS